MRSRSFPNRICTYAHSTTSSSPIGGKEGSEVGEIECVIFRFALRNVFRPRRQEEKQRRRGERRPLYTFHFVLSLASITLRCRVGGIHIRLTVWREEEDGVRGKEGKQINDLRRGKFAFLEGLLAFIPTLGQKGIETLNYMNLSSLNRVE